MIINVDLRQLYSWREVFMAHIGPGGKSPEELKRIQELRRSAAATSHDARPNKERTKGDIKKKAIEDSKEK